jgi:hypothetical protein
LTLRALAHQALSHGLSVVPPREDGSKAPAAEWKQYQLRLPTEAELDRWYGNGRTGIGVVCGRVSGNLEMLEFEGRAVADGMYADFCEVIEQAGLWPVWSRIESGYMEVTPSGGYHFLYRSKDIPGNAKLARRRNSFSGVDVLIETRGEGGYVILAPSSGPVHPTGKPWQLAEGGFETIANITTDEREQIHRIARSFNQLDDPDTRPASLVESDTTAPGHLYNADPQVVEKTLALLEKHGWSKVYTKAGVHYLRRPGKKDGISATLGHPDTGHGFYVFTTSTEFDSERRYSPFAVYTLLEHAGEWSAAASSLRGEGYTEDVDLNVTVKVPEVRAEPDIDPRMRFIDFYEVLTGVFEDEQWLVYPMLPKGRQIALYATGKTGKSLLLLEIAAALATGRPVLGNPAEPPIHVLYIDFEMTPGDLQERLKALGYSHTGAEFEKLKKHLHYAQMPSIPFLDSPDGGAVVEQAVQATQSQLVVIDTLIRSVEGEENSADTIKNFYRHTGMRLKAAGVTTVRADHSGKDATRGQRGTSAKRDDLDVVWRLDVAVEMSDHQLLNLVCDAARMSWVPKTISLRR